MEFKFYQILKADPLGDPWSANGGSFQTFWCQFAGVDAPVKVNKKVGSTPSLVYGQFGYLIEKESQKGNKYYQFKGQKAPEELEQPRYDASDAGVATKAPVKQHPSDDMPAWFKPYADKIDAIWNEVKPGDVPEDFDKKPEVDKAMLEDTFGGPLGEIVDPSEFENEEPEEPDEPAV